MKSRPAFDPWLSTEKGSQDNCRNRQAIKVPLFSVAEQRIMNVAVIAWKVLVSKKEEIQFIDRIHIPSAWWRKKKSLPILLVLIPAGGMSACVTRFVRLGISFMA